MPAKAARPSWLPPHFIALTSRNGTPLYVQARAITAFSGRDTDGAFVVAVGMDDEAYVIETPAEVAQAITVATA